MTSERTLDSRYVYEGRAVNLRVDTVVKPDGSTTTREIVEHPDCVVVVAIDEAGRAMLVRQFREAVEHELLELPAGGIDPGEKPDDTVRRELQEEIGYLPQKIEALGGFYSSPGFCTEYLHLYLATDLKPSRLFAEDTAAIKVVPVPLADIPRLIAAGEIRDSKSIAGLLRVILERRKPRE